MDKELEKTTNQIIQFYNSRSKVSFTDEFGRNWEGIIDDFTPSGDTENGIADFGITPTIMPIKLPQNIGAFFGVDTVSNLKAVNLNYDTSKIIKLPDREAKELKEM